MLPCYRRPNNNVRTKALLQAFRLLEASVPVPWQQNEKQGKFIISSDSNLENSSPPLPMIEQLEPKTAPAAWLLKFKAAREESKIDLLHDPDRALSYLVDKAS